jgi:hypothetical protein
MPVVNVRLKRDGHMKRAPYAATGSPRVQACGGLSDMIRASKRVHYVLYIMYST